MFLLKSIYIKNTSFVEKAKIEKNCFFIHFQTVFVDFRCEIREKKFKLSIKVENGWILWNYILKPSQRPKAGQNTQHLFVLEVAEHTQ